MADYLLDTDVVIVLLANANRKLQSRLASMPAERLRLSSIVVAELRYRQLDPLDGGDPTNPKRGPKRGQSAFSSAAGGWTWGNGPERDLCGLTPH